MKNVLKFVLPAAVALTAVGVQAQTIETHYPAVTGNVGVAVTAPAPQFAASGVSARVEPLLVQSNFEGPTANPAYAAPSTLTRAEVRSSATIAEPRGPGHNA